MMRCRNARILITKRLYETLAPEEGAALQQHLAACLSCREAQAETARFESDLRGLQAKGPASSISPAAVDLPAILSRTRRARGWHFAFRQGRRFTVAAIGAVGAAALIGLWLRLSPGLLHHRVVAERPPRGPSRGLSGPPRHRSGAGEKRTRLHPIGITDERPRLAIRSTVSGVLGAPEWTPGAAQTISPPTILPPGGSQRNRSTAPTGRRSPDDRYLDGRDPVLMTQWLAGDDRQRKALEWLKHRLPPMRDDFVRAPFPQLAALEPTGSMLARAVANYEKEAKVIDVRLFQHVTLQQRSVSLEVLCAELERQTGVRIRADRSVRDEKVTVFVEDRPAREVMRAVARLFGDFWTRSRQAFRRSGVQAFGNDDADLNARTPERLNADYQYELSQDLKTQLAEQEMRNQDLDAALVALDAQMAVYKPYLDLDPAQVAERARRASGPEKALLERVTGPNWGGMQLYHRLTPPERAALATGEPLRFSTDSPRADRRLPEAWRRPLLQTWGDIAMAWSEADHNLVVAPLQSLRDRGLAATPLIEWPDASVDVTLRINRTELGELSLEATSGYVMPYKDRTPGAGSTVTLATAQSPSVARPDNAAANQALRHQSPFIREISLHPQPSCPWFASAARASGRSTENTEDHGGPWQSRAGELGRRTAAAPGPDAFSSPSSRSPSAPLRDPSEPPNTVSWRALTEEEGQRQARRQQPHVSTADVWEAVHRATGLPIVADAYTHLYPAAAVQVEKATLFEALCRVADEVHCRWRKDGDFLLCRSTSFFWDQLKEVPNRILAHWQGDKQKQGGLPFGDMLEMAALPDYALDSQIVADGISHCWGLEEWDLLATPPGGYSPRPWLRLLAELPPESQRLALTPEGLEVSRLTLPQRQDVLTVMGPRIVSDDPAQALEAAAHWKIRVGYAPAGWYAWTPRFVKPQDREQAERLPLVAAPTAAAALAAARKIDPSVAAAQIERTAGALTITLLFPNGSAWTVAGERPMRFGLTP